MCCRYTDSYTTEGTLRRFFLVDSNSERHLSAEGRSQKNLVKNKKLEFTCKTLGGFERSIPLHTCMRRGDLIQWLEQCMEEGRRHGRGVVGVLGCLLKSPQGFAYVQCVPLASASILPTSSLKAVNRKFELFYKQAMYSS